MDVVATRLAVGTKAGLWLGTAADGGWRLDGPHLPMREVPALLWRDDGRLLVGTRSEHFGPTVLATADDGVTWQEPDVAPIAFAADDGATLERVWQLAADPGDADVVWAGCEPTSVWRSEDGGRSFALVRGLWDHPHRPDWWPGAGGAAVHTVLPEPDGSPTLTVAMSTGGVYRSADRGDSWSPANRGIAAPYMPGPEPEYGQCVHKVARDAGSPDVLYAQNHGGVYRTDDDGGQWTSIDEGLPGDFGFVVLAHPTQGDTMWLVPIASDGERIPPAAELQVQRTDDAGATWRTQHEGLPSPSYTERAARRRRAGHP